MKLSTIFVFCLILSACEADRTYDFSCHCNFQFVLIGEGCPNERNDYVNGIILRDYNFSEMRQFEKTSESIFPFAGRLWNVKKYNCHCLETYCGHN